MDIQSMRPIALKWGIIKGIASVLISLLALQFMGNPVASLINLPLMLAVPIIVLVFAFKEYKQVKEGFLLLKEAIVLGLGIYLVEFVVSIAWNALYNYVINPNAQQEAMDRAMEQMEQSPGMSDGMLDFFEGMMSMSTSFGAQVLTGLIGAFFFGAIWSLIIGAIMRNEP